MAEIKILQIFTNVDFRNQELGLARMVDQEHEAGRCMRKRNALERGEVFLFINRSMSQYRMIGKRGFMAVRLGREETADLSVRLESVLKKGAEFFGISPAVSPTLQKAFTKARKLTVGKRS